MISAEQRKSNRLEAMKFFIESGFTPEQAAGIIGNLMVESGMDPDIHEIGGGAGFGLAQWTAKSRKKALAEYAHVMDTTVGNFHMQLLFIRHEYESPGFESALRALKRAKTASDSAVAVCKFYEIPGIPHLVRRIEWANKALAEYLEAKEVQT
jgi:hypothetical protein